MEVAGGQVESCWELGFRGEGRRSWLGAPRISITDGKRQARVHVSEGQTCARRQTSISEGEPGEAEAKCVWSICEGGQVHDLGGRGSRSGGQAGQVSGKCGWSICEWGMWRVRRQRSVAEEMRMRCRVLC